jgi:alkyl hydroperoxide reductase subunit AhpC
MAEAALGKGLLLGDTAPDFVADTTLGRIRFYEWLSESWGIFFSHPRDFTPVCTTELGQISRLKPEFDKRNVKIIALSVDPVESHQRWIADINETQNTIIAFPMIGDEQGRVAEMYGMFHPALSQTSTVRSVFIIDPAKKIRLTINYPMATGRNFNEILRVIDALQLTDRYSVSTPANWKWGDDCIILPSLTDPNILKEKFPQGWKEVKPYLRLTPQPGKKP